jgi:diketogulonate reductase-like aldo/keto reductase
MKIPRTRPPLLVAAHPRATIGSEPAVTLLMRMVALPSGEQVPALGMGTWHMGESRARRAEEIATLRLGLDLGLTLIDTAEMYGEGRSEELVGEAIGGRRREVFLVTKVYPHNASRRGAASACERSLRRLRVDHVDLYLLHWRGTVPLAETIEAFILLQEAGKIRHFGVSNLDLADMHELWSAPGGCDVQTDQLLYNPERRGSEWDLLPWLRQHRIPLMAYSPIEQGRLLSNLNLADFAQRHSMTPAQVVLAWLLIRDDIIAIPKTSNAERMKDNAAALNFRLTPSQLVELDRMFPPPAGPRPLEMI